MRHTSIAAIILAILFSGIPLLAAPATQPTEAPRAHRDALIAKAKARMKKDTDKYTREQLRECEDLYQMANKNWQAPEVVTTLKVMIEKFPDVNRTGCAVLYLAQKSRGKEREDRLTQAIEKFSDCWYLNGAQVGALARFYRGIDLWQAGQKDAAKKLFDEVKKDYAGAISHKGILLSSLIEQIESAPANQPAEQ